MGKTRQTGEIATLDALPPEVNRIDANFGEPRGFLNNRYIYLVVSQRARGLSIGVNLNPDQVCNFNCVYCEINRNKAENEQRINLRALSSELKRVLNLIQEDQTKDLPCFRSVPCELLQLREVALSGDGEPTLCPNFAEVVEVVVHLRAMGSVPSHKMVLITNGTGLHIPEVQRGLRWFTCQDEIWVKLDAGSQAAFDRVNRAGMPLEQILSNAVMLGRQRPIVIQSLFPLLHGQEPSADEIDDYVQRLAELKDAGARISLVQIYSAHRPASSPGCQHLSLKTLSSIAHRVRSITGLDAEVF